MQPGPQNLTAGAVKEQYERYPFPYYPIFLPLDSRKGALSSSVYAAQLFEASTNQRASIRIPEEQFCPRDKTVFVAGCGDTLPYIIKKWEPRTHKLLCLDISQNNIERCRKRMLFARRNTRFVCDDIDQFMLKEGKVAGPYDHIDLFGVLHHLPNPGLTLNSLAKSLHANGTMRIMVYNQQARLWIVHLQHAFKYLGFNYSNPGDLGRARLILGELATLSPQLATKLDRMTALLQHDHRFVDAFFHCREARIAISSWFDIIQQNDLKIMGLLDEYGELDDLPNPLWLPPTAAELEARGKDRRLENNLLLFLRKLTICDEKRSSAQQSRKIKFSFQRKLLAGPPPSWFQYNETRAIGFLQRQHLWQHFLRVIATGEGSFIKTDAFPLSTLQRLARIGALLPGMVADKSLLPKLAEPMTEQMEPPETLPSRESLRSTKLARLVMDILNEKHLFSERRFFTIMERLLRAQK